MKKVISILLLLFVLSCKKDNYIQISDTLTSGTWTISKYIDNGDNETSDFTGYTFNFNIDGSIVAVKDGTGVVGNWSELNDDDNLKLNILFSQTTLSELNDDWDLKSKSDNMIELEDISGDGSIDNLTFVK